MTCLNFAPDSIEPVVAWRAWRFGFKGDYLTSLMPVSSEMRWPHGKAVAARCSKASPLHQAPDIECTCGYYALKAIEGIEEIVAGEIISNHIQDAFSPMVYGQVSLWGEVVEGSEGYRAEFAYPKLILVPYRFSAMIDGELIDATTAAELLRDRYNCEVQVEYVTDSRADAEIARLSSALEQPFISFIEKLNSGGWVRVRDRKVRLLADGNIEERSAFSLPVHFILLVCWAALCAGVSLASTHLLGKGWISTLPPIALIVGFFVWEVIRTRQRLTYYRQVQLFVK